MYAGILASHAPLTQLRSSQFFAYFYKTHASQPDAGLLPKAAPARAAEHVIAYIGAPGSVRSGAFPIPPYPDVISGSRKSGMIRLRRDGLWIFQPGSRAGSAVMAGDGSVAA